MSTAMRSTLQTVPESLEVTKTNTTTQDAPTTATTKTPAKATVEAVATKSSRSYNYNAPTSTNKEFLASEGPLVWLAQAPAASQNTKNNPNINQCGVKKANQPTFKDSQSDYGYEMLHILKGVNFVPRRYVYDATEGIFISYKLHDIHIATKILEGPYKVKYVEDGVLREKKRYHLIKWPEMVHENTPKIERIFRQLLEENMINVPLRIIRPSNDIIQAMGKRALILYSQRLKENGGNNPATLSGCTTFQLGELHKKDTIKLKKMHAISSRFYNRFWNAFVQEVDRRCDVEVENSGLMLESSGEVMDFSKCTNIVEFRKEECYISNYLPWVFTQTDLRKWFWRLICIIFCCKPVIIERTVYDVDVLRYIVQKTDLEDRIFERDEMQREFSSTTQSF